MNKISSFTDLICWKEAHNLALLIYNYTESFPNKEVYSLTDQMRRAAVSIPSNIAEGFCKNTKKDKRRYYNNAQGSLAEVQSQSLIAKDLEYLNKKDFLKLISKQLL